MNKYRVEIDTNNTIRIWDNENPNENNAPFMLQPDWPDVSPWENAAQANDWAEVFIASMLDPLSEFVAGNSPDTHPALRPEQEMTTE